MSEFPAHVSIGALNAPKWVQHTLAGDLFHLLLEKYSYRFYWGEVISSYIAMVLGTVVLGPIICQVASAWAPMEPELKSCLSVPDPVKPHVH